MDISSACLLGDFDFVSNFFAEKKEHEIETMVINSFGVKESIWLRLKKHEKSMFYQFYEKKDITLLIIIYKKYLFIKKIIKKHKKTRKMAKTRVLGFAYPRASNEGGPKNSLFSLFLTFFNNFIRFYKNIYIYCILYL
mgnify:CR=1 FL=1